MNETSTQDIANILDQFTRTYTASQVCSELRILVERINFMIDPVMLENNLTHTQAKAKIERVLKEDFSEGLRGFALYLFEHNMLGFLTEKKGRELISYCDEYFFKSNEVRFVSAITLSSEQKKMVSNKIRHMFPPRTRILFELNISLIAGFMVIEGDNKVHDYSLRKNAAILIKRYLTETKNSVAGEA